MSKNGANSNGQQSPRAKPCGECACGKWEHAPLAQEIFVLHNLMMKIGDRIVAPLGLTGSRWLLLGAIMQQEQPPMLSQLSSHALLSVQNVSRMVAAMERDGLIERFTKPGMGRATFVRLTEKGEEVHHRALAAARLFTRHFLHGFSESELQRSSSDVDRLIRNLGEFERQLSGGMIDLENELERLQVSRHETAREEMAR